jgi:hypothetical protein
MEQCALKNVNNYSNTNIYSYLETSGGQSSNLYLNVVHFLTPALNRYLWQIKTVVFLHWCLICTVLLHTLLNQFYTSQVMLHHLLLLKRSQCFREIGSYSVLFTFLVGWHASAVSLPPVGVIFARLACPLNDVIFC